MWDVLIRFMMRFLLHSFAAARPTEVTIATFVLKQRPPPPPRAPVTNLVGVGGLGAWEGREVSTVGSFPSGCLWFA